MTSSRPSDVDTAAPGTTTMVAPPPSQGWRHRLRGLLDRQIVRFAMVGVVNSAFGYSVFAAFQISFGRQVHYLAVLGIAHVIGVLEAYLLARWLVFQVRGRWWRELLRFWSVYLVALGINAVALPLLVEVAHLAVLLAQAIIMFGTAFGSFFAHQNYTFRRAGAPGPGTEGEVRLAGEQRAANDPPAP